MSRRPRLLALALALISFAPSAARACSICRSDDPALVVPGDDRFVARSWRLSFEAERNSKDQASGADADGLAVQGRERETELRYTATGSWTVRPHLALLARVPWSQRSIDSGPLETQRRSGFADPELLVDWAVLSVPGSSAPHWITLQLGLRPPWGQNEMTLRGERADEHLQPGSGAAGGSAGLSTFVRVGERSAVYGSVIGRMNGPNRHGYAYGNALIGSVALQREATAWLKATLELDARFAGSDRVAGGTRPDTGGGVLYVTPRVQFGVSPRVALRVGVQVPVARDLFGDQREFANVQTSVVLLP